MKRLILLLLGIILLAGVGAASADPYKLVMSKEKELCSGVLKLFNADMKKYGEIRYEQHEVFSQVHWEPVDIGEEGPARGCSIILKSLLDINNDGKEDLVIRSRGCLRSQLTDSIYVFPPDSDVISKLKPGKGGLAALDTVNKIELSGHGYDLKKLPKSMKEKVLKDIRGQLPESQKGIDLKPGIGGVLVLQPFVWGKTTYTSMTDLHQEWIVIVKYLQGETLEDRCYFHGKSLIKS